MGLSNEDRELLRERVRARLEATERSQRQLETELGWSSGTLTRVFGGRKQLDGELLVQLADGLGVAAASLVEGTDLASLVEVVPGGPADAPTTPAEPEVLTELPTTDATTEAPSEPTTEASSEAPTESVTKAPSDAPTEPTTEPTEPTTEPIPEPPAPQDAVQTAPRDAPLEEDDTSAPEASATGGSGGVRGWLRSIVKRVFGSRQE